MRRARGSSKMLRGLLPGNHFEDGTARAVSLYAGTRVVHPVAVSEIGQGHPAAAELETINPATTFEMEQNERRWELQG